MDTRLIFESHKTFKPKINWTEANNTESEWTTFDLTREELIQHLYKVITDFFIADTLHVAIDRNNSFTIDKQNILEKIRALLNVSDFNIWNEQFTKTMEFNKIGVYRTGIISN